MTEAEGERKSYPYVVDRYPNDPADRSFIFYKAAQGLGFNLEIEDDQGETGRTVQQVTSASAEEMQRLRSLEGSFLNTPIGTLIELISKGQYVPFMHKHPELFFSNIGKMLSYVSIDLRYRAFLNAFERNEEIGLNPAPTGHNLPIRLLALNRYHGLIAQGEIPIQSTEMEEHAIGQLADIVNLLRQNPFDAQM